ncbi:hypothetical protein PPERSA_04025 [Pseudocohnilembus persalinus]|uniref:Uncharacterized protein n=1 Tax=Pseudocohnilembus persalinus TaxID=266149 RepID=A0A0V0QKU2_PSEPJ|nr:hypothetical protein PPERSA_04025 [Pseudocohnilembus persalinus]|eukprot:KRX02822.1 hypothetical protein PPERSA_04025 [Pseudocohnilembus persalinus]
MQEFCSNQKSFNSLQNEPQISEKDSEEDTICESIELDNDQDIESQIILNNIANQNEKQVNNQESKNKDKNNEKQQQQKQQQQFQNYLDQIQEDDEIMYKVRFCFQDFQDLKEQDKKYFFQDLVQIYDKLVQNQIKNQNQFVDNTSSDESYLGGNQNNENSQQKLKIQQVYQRNQDRDRQNGDNYDLSNNNENNYQNSWDQFLSDQQKQQNCDVNKEMVIGKFKEQNKKKDFFNEENYQEQEQLNDYKDILYFGIKICDNDFINDDDDNDDCDLKEYNIRQKIQQNNDSMEILNNDSLSNQNNNDTNNNSSIELKYINSYQSESSDIDSLDNLELDIQNNQVKNCATCTIINRINSVICRCCGEKF